MDGTMYECDCGDWTTNSNKMCETCILLRDMENEKKKKIEVTQVIQ